MPGISTELRVSDFQNDDGSEDLELKKLTWVIVFDMCVCNKLIQKILNWVLMECNVIKTYSFVSFDLIYYYDSLGNRPKFELCGIFSCLYMLGFML